MASRLKGLLAAIALGLAGCVEPKATTPSDGSSYHPSSDRPQRIVSLDYCADQYVLKFVDRDRIAALSVEAEADFSYMREAAVDVPKVRPVAEDALLLKPDLIVRSYGGGPNAAAFFERAGVPVLNVGWANDLEGVKAVIMHMAEGLDETERGRAVIAEMETRLAAISGVETSQTALYLTAGGATTGPGSIIHEAIEAAGFQNFEEKPGWRMISLEQLVYKQPDVVASAFFNSWAHHNGPWSAAHHPVVRRLSKEDNIIALDPASTTCAGWFILDVVEMLARAGAKGASVEE